MERPKVGDEVVSITDKNNPGKIVFVHDKGYVVNFPGWMTLAAYEMSSFGKNILRYVKPKEPGQIAYDAYYQEAGFQWQEWEQISAHRKKCWAAAAKTVNVSCSRST